MRNEVIRVADAIAKVRPVGPQDHETRTYRARSRDLVRLTTFTPEAWMPVWVISYRLFGTAEYADDILAMNPHITHPLLVPPGRALRVARH